MVEKIWLKCKYWPKEVPAEVDIPLIRLDEFITRGVKEDPEMHAFWFMEAYYSYRWLDDNVNKFANVLQKVLGAKENDVLAIALPNCPQFVVAYYAAQRIGMTVTTLNPTYAEAEMIHCLTGSKAKFLITLDAVWEKILKQGAILKGLPVADPKNVVITNVVDEAHGLPGFKKVLGKKIKDKKTGQPMIPSGKAPGCPQYLALMKKATTDVTPANYDVKTHVAALLWTGGTTGMPKAAMLSTYNIVANSYQMMAWFFTAKKGSCILGVLPAFHVFGGVSVLCVSLCVKGWAIYYVKPPETEVMLKELEEIKKENPTSNFFYPGAEILFKRIADLPMETIQKYDIKGIFDLCISAAGPLHREVQEAFETRTGAKLVEAYGLTEASPAVSAGNFFGERKIGFIGLPFSSTEWKLVDRETGKDLQGFGPEVMGEIAVAGPQVMMGYLPSSSKDAAEQSKKTVVKYADGKLWLLTGDIGYMDEDGMIKIMDRKKELIKYKGHSVFPKEVEELMYQNEAVLEVAVAGIPDPDAGEVVKAYIVLKPEFKGKVTEQDLIKWSKDKMAVWKTPTLIEFKEELPKTMVGKVLRRILQDETIKKMQADKAAKK
nr:AMP-binding protein [Candidatus Sigynarchaeota archaeon]